MRLFALGLTLSLFPVLAFAQDVLPDPENMQAFIAALAAAVKAGNWPMVVVLALVGVVWALRKYGTKRIPFFQTEDGAVMLAALVAFVGSITSAVVAGGPIAWGSVLVVAFIGAAKMGGTWAVVKSAIKLLLPKIAPKLSKVPGVGTVVFWLVKSIFNVTVPTPQSTEAMRSRLGLREAEDVEPAAGDVHVIRKDNPTPGELPPA